MEESNIEIVFPNSWILNRAGKELNGLEGKGTYFINYALYDESKPRPHGAFFTHLEPKWKKKFDEVASKVDFAVCSNETIKQYLIDKGIKRVEVIRHGHQPELKKNIRCGVVGRTYPSGRKGEYLIANAVEAGFDVIAMGDGWPCEVSGEWSDPREFYNLIDYLIIPSLIEGGPVPLIDAIAYGVPVIAPREVGHCDEFPCIRYDKGDWDSLKEVLTKLTHPPTWNEWLTKHQELFRSYLKK